MIPTWGNIPTQGDLNAGRFLHGAITTQAIPACDDSGVRGDSSGREGALTGSLPLVWEPHTSIASI